MTKVRWVCFGYSNTARKRTSASGQRLTFPVSLWGRKQTLRPSYDPDTLFAMNDQSKIALASGTAVILLSDCAGFRDLHARPETAFQVQVSRAIPLGIPISEPTRC